MKQIKVRAILKDYSIYIILFIVILYGIFGVNLFIKPRNLYNLMLNICLYGIPAIGMTFIMLTGNIDLSIGRLVALCAITACMTSGSLGFLPSFLFTLIIGISISYLTSKIVTHFSIDPLITTLGIQVVLEGFSLLITNDQTIRNTNPILENLYTYRLFGIIPIPLIIFLLLLVTSVFITRFSKFGINIYVVGGNREAGELAGINVSHLQTACWIIAGFCAAVGGVVMASRVNSGSTVMGNTLNMTIIASCVLGGVSFSGGRGSHLKMLAGVIVIQTVSNIMALKGTIGATQSLVTGAVLVLVLILDRYTQNQKETA